MIIVKCFYKHRLTNEGIIMQYAFACLFILSYFSIGTCLIEEIELPQHLKECIIMKTKYNDVTKSTSEAVCNTCVTRYMWMNGPNLRNCGHPQDNATMSDITDFVGKLLCPKLSGKRKKRQAGRRYRKEIRMLTSGERQRLRNAWSQAYRSGYFGWIARFHNSQVRTSAHSGPAFLGYHRFLILILELVLQYYDPSVTMPYWNSGLDANMDTPANSILWTAEYLGEMSGVVRTGICGGFQDVRGNAIIRNVGNAGSLFTSAEVRDVMRMPNINRLTEPSPYPTLESYHDDVHNYVGGSMGPIELAPWDCVFWLHHTFVDYLWEVWRYGHQYNTAYPHKTGVPQQLPNVVMRNMPVVQFLGRIPTNRDGYGVQLARKSFYQLSPTCSRQNTYCGSPDLQCRFGTNGAECAAVDKNFRRRTQPLVDARRNGRVQMNFRNRQNKRRKRDTRVHHTTIHHSFKITVNSQQITNIYLPQEREPCMGKPIQNNFIAGCACDVRKWAFIPIKVVHLRPREAHFASQSDVNGNPSRYDMYDEHKYKDLENLVRPGNPATYNDCVEDESGAFKVRLKSTGLSYFGTYTDYVFVDNRLPISSHIGYIAVQKPTANKPTEVMITASDACGRLCKPTCRKWENGNLYYVSCTGAIKVTAQSPLMYGNDFGDAVLSIWQFYGKFTPIERESNIYMEFFCDYSNEWIWKECNPKKG
ncbi:TYR [Mytilus coruscus]|uniref:TYR n=1 Tax=Mytilus coruscus TaxID=42192 RepID=A0A6J8EA39_MYTCO|nr:TYR [Mytilus coruscus]